MTGYERSPDYGGPRPRFWPIAIGLIIAAAIVAYSVFAF